MKHGKTGFFGALSALAVVLGAIGCSSTSSLESLNAASAGGPIIIEPRVEPGTLKVDRNLQPVEPGEIRVDVKDYTSDVAEVTVQLSRLPIEIPMENMGGTTWRASLDPEQVRTLAINGRTMSYDAQIVARNFAGKVSSKPLQIKVEAPASGSQG